MSIYCDASVIVAALTGEVATRQAQQWLANQDDGTLVVSLWVDTEVASALARKQRERVLTEAQSRAAYAHWQELRAGWHVIAVEDSHFTVASTLTSHGLRAGDALHLAIVLHHYAELATGDRLLARVAAVQGISVREIGRDVDTPAS